MSINEAEALEFRPKETELYSPETAKRQVAFIQKIMAAVMQDGQHFGTIPGCGPKPTLLKPGAEKLCMVFRLSSEYDIMKTNLPNGHREYEVTCKLSAIDSGKPQGEGVGMATSMESKWRFRNSALICPECGQETIIKGKEQYGGGFICFAKKGGCGAKFKDNDPKIKDQKVGKVENENPSDQFNTVLKMAKKRAHVDAVLSVLSASDIFTQDIEDMDIRPRNDPPPQTEKKEPEEKKKSSGKKNTEKAKTPDPEDDIPDPETITDEQGQALIDLAKANEWAESTFRELLKSFGIASGRVRDIPLDRFEEIKAELSAE